MCHRRFFPHQQTLSSTDSDDLDFSFLPLVLSTYTAGIHRLSQGLLNVIQGEWIGSLQAHEHNLPLTHFNSYHSTYNFDYRQGLKILNPTLVIKSGITRTWPIVYVYASFPL